MKRHVFITFIKILCLAVVVGSISVFFQNQKQQSYEDILSSPAKAVSSKPVNYTTVTGSVENKKQIGEHIENKEQKNAQRNRERANTPLKEKQQAFNQKQQLNTKEENAENNQKTQKKDNESERVKNSSNMTNSVKRENKGEETSQIRGEEGSYGEKKQQTSPSEKKGQQTKTKDEAENKQIINGEEDTNTYFTTTIIDGETVTEEKYHFSITQKNPHETVLGTRVTVNDLPQENFNGTVILHKGANKIVVQATYDNEISPNVEREYTVYYEQNKLVIQTNLQDGLTTTNKNIAFTANATFNDEQKDVTVNLNGELLTKKEEGTYEVSLKEGTNTIIMSAHKEEEQVTKTVHVIYKKKQQQIEFETDLQNKQVATAELTFYATAELNGKPLPLTATLNGEKLEENKHLFFDLLQPGKNVVMLSAEINGEKETESYTIYYREPEETTTSETPNDKNGPKIVTDIQNGSQIRGSIKNIIVWATDSEGKQLPASGVSVKVNSKAGQLIWADNAKISYKLKLIEGKNNITVKAWDSEGRISTKKYTIYAKNIDEGKVIGTATISVEATTVGLGYLIPPTEVELHENEKGSYVIDQLLREKGFTYENTGTVDTNFYLASISKENITKGVQIPSDLEKLVRKYADYFESTDYTANRLGEFDFSSASGWMYSINGDYPNYGFSDAYFLDGDVIRIRYTLFYGNDINGGTISGNNKGNKEGKEYDWNKEW